SRYGAATFTPAAVAELLESLMRETDHRFVPDDISLLDDSLVMSSHLLASNQVTDTYLLAVAVKNGAMLATLDQRLATQAVHNGSEQLHLI
ncbi:MAG: TA system VapC family ribonuclease toxin, partial [Thermomicrobiales bacterium]